jgi:hypothetical protein
MQDQGRKLKNLVPGMVELGTPSCVNPISDGVREGKMKITDYESGRSLRDVGISLTAEEAQELVAYLSRMLANPSISHVHLSELSHWGIEREVAFALEEKAALVRQDIRHANFCSVA